mmetsp:Transcript_12825/g.20018  ORF Transcript_12825/g.20018 Transcript_12825/m.20018 type:complete len:216 (-) Transcript_12825:48-695(-)
MLPGWIPMLMRMYVHFNKAPWASAGQAMGPPGPPELTPNAGLSWQACRRARTHGSCLCDDTAMAVAPLWCYSDSASRENSTGSGLTTRLLTPAPNTLWGTKPSRVYWAGTTGDSHGGGGQTGTGQGAPTSRKDWDRVSQVLHDGCSYVVALLKRHHQGTSHQPGVPQACDGEDGVASVPVGQVHCINQSPIREYGDAVFAHEEVSSSNPVSTPVP